MVGNNIVLLTDSYKVTHACQYPPGTEYVYSYFESRGGGFPSTVFFGLQYIMYRYLNGQIVSNEKIDNAKEKLRLHFGRDLMNEDGWRHIANDHHGYLPISIKAVPEGSRIPTHNVLMTVVNTCHRCYWLTNYIETLLVEVWYPTTVATLSSEIRKLILKYLYITGDASLIDFKLHDFGFRGVSSVESAAIGGSAHLVNFLGTDTLVALELCDEYYDEKCAGFSIPAAEHSTITSWMKDHEIDAFRNMLEQYPSGLVAVVSDSYDIFKACSEYWGKELHDYVLKRDGTLVIRPDSGEPVDVILEILDLLDKSFGSSPNNKGYRVLDPHVRVIWGDGINYDGIDLILSAMESNGWSADNIAFGMGGALLQKPHRDSQKFAFKCSAIRVNGEWRDVYKEPVTDPGKTSKRGRLSLICENDVYKTVQELSLTHQSNQILLDVRDEEKDELIEVYRNGVVLLRWPMSFIRSEAKK